MVQSPLLFHIRVFGTFNNSFSIDVSNENRAQAVFVRFILAGIKGNLKDL